MNAPDLFKNAADDPFANRVTKLLGINYPIIQAGMIWASGWELAGAVSNAGGLGVLGSGSMYPEVLERQILQCKAATDKPFAVNVPLMYPAAGQHIQTIIDQRIPIVFTSAGNPAIHTKRLADHGIVVIHVVSSSLFAAKAEKAGCHAVVAEGFEAGGHNGREETTSLVLIPAVSRAVSIPVIAAGGIATGTQMLAAMVLGAEGVQVGSRFVASVEASSHAAFKQAVIDSREGDTRLVLKQLAPVRLLKNAFYELVKEAETRGAQPAELLTLLGKGRSRMGMFEGDLENGELEIGQVACLFNEVLPAATIMDSIWREFREALENPVRKY